MKERLERIYAGFLGMNIGIRLGAPVEPTPWDFDKIAQFYGDIRGYLKQYRNFAADDDVNGPVYFLRALLDNGIEKPLTPQAVGEAWLNYARDGIGLYWWGGEGVSTEHTAYLNLKRGIPAPRSGSIEQNGIVLAEQIGGQIFIDTWGLICLGEPQRAAELARIAASVSHDGNGLHGAAFIAACIAAAYRAQSVAQVIAEGLQELPPDCTYRAVVEAVCRFHAEQPEDFRACMRYLEANWGYDRYPGVCHIIPNAGVCVLALLYGAGDFSRTVEIATMCGWDTDCNAGNVGTILGVFCGLGGIPAHYRQPINDFIVLSGISGYLNNLDVASYAKLLYQLSLRFRGQPEDTGVRLPRGGELLFDFSLPGATHGLRLSNNIRFMKHSTAEGLELVIDRILPEDSCDVYYKPFYRRSDFDDERYKPVFSPTVYSGQMLRCELTPHFFIGGSVTLQPYLRTAIRGDLIYGAAVTLIHDELLKLEFLLPNTKGDCISEIGFRIVASPETKNRIFAVLRLHLITVTGKGCYSIDTSLCKREFLQLTPFSLNHGEWSVENASLTCRTQEPAQAYTGNYYATDVSLTAEVVAAKGVCLIARATGARCYLAAGFTDDGCVGFISHANGKATRVSCHLAWKAGQTYELTLRIYGSCAAILLNGEAVFSQTLEMSAYGMVGFAMEQAGSASIRNLRVEESGPYVPLLPPKSFS